MKMLLQNLVVLQLVIATICTPLTATKTQDVTIVSYEEFLKEDSTEVIKKALYTQGIIGIRGIPGFRKAVDTFIAANRKFSALTSEIKNQYCPNRAAGDVTGHEKGKEQFMLQDGTWAIDDAKASYYAYVPDNESNKWPAEVELQAPFQTLAGILSQYGKRVMEKVGLLGKSAPIEKVADYQVARMLCYHANSKNPLWCGAHYDHGIFTALCPARYFMADTQIKEPEEAGLFIRSPNETEFKKVTSDDPDVLLFQVGEWGQIASNDAITATEHRVQSADIPCERFTMALFFTAPGNSEVTSTSVLTEDSRYGEAESCTFSHWNEASLARYEVKQ